ncbi:hypothetical protein [Streptomyces sp. NPDC093060]|uniref:hypothetical protein n=1 Tax=Streptomyces sp. NPDC093060 TaxID=3366019 RepID=UPI003806A562
MRQNLTHRQVTVDNYRDLKLELAPVRPDPERVEESTAVLAAALRDGRRIVLLAGFGAIRSHAEAAVQDFVRPMSSTLEVHVIGGLTWDKAARWVRA